MGKERNHFLIDRCQVDRSLWQSKKHLFYLEDFVQHTSLDSFYKWTEISSLEIDIFDLKNGKKVV